MEEFDQLLQDVKLDNNTVDQQPFPKKSTKEHELFGKIENNWESEVMLYGRNVLSCKYVEKNSKVSAIYFS